MTTDAGVIGGLFPCERKLTILWQVKAVAYIFEVFRFAYFKKKSAIRNFL